VAQVAGATFVVTWRVLPGGQCAPLSPIEDLLGDTEALIADVEFLIDQSRRLITHSQELVTLSRVPPRRKIDLRYSSRSQPFSEA
jgi:hypothetical protein